VLLVDIGGCLFSSTNNTSHLITTQLVVFLTHLIAEQRRLSVLSLQEVYADVFSWGVGL
jgi:hypothetical protein